MDCIALQKVRIGGHRPQVIDGNNFDAGTFVLDHRAQGQTTNAAKAVDSDANCHDC